MNTETMNSDDSYSDDDEEEELDPRIQDELEKLNAATNSINHLEAELDEARAVFRQTLAGATYHLNGIAQKLGKCVEKSRPFYESYRQLRQSHGMLQKSTNKYERASGMHIAAKTRVNEAEKRVFGGGPKRAFDTALQEMLNQATIEVNEAEKLKRDSWKQHQEDLQAYRDIEFKVKKLYKKLKGPVDKAKPYFEQKREFDRHLWQLKLRVDSIQIGLSGAKENYSACLQSLEIISDDIHEKRKRKRMDMMLSKLQERESGVGADSSTEDETSLTASNLDLDFDSSLNFDKLEGLSDDLVGEWSAQRAASCSELDHLGAQGSALFTKGKTPSSERVVYGIESSDNVDNKDNNEYLKKEDITDKHVKEIASGSASQDTIDSDCVVRIQIGTYDESVPNDYPITDRSSVGETNSKAEGSRDELTAIDKSDVVEETTSQDQSSEGQSTTTDNVSVAEEISHDQTCEEDSTTIDKSDVVEETSQDQSSEGQSTTADNASVSEEISHDQNCEEDSTTIDKSKVVEETPQDQLSLEQSTTTDNASVAREISHDQNCQEDSTTIDKSDVVEEISSEDQSSQDQSTTTDKSNSEEESISQDKATNEEIKTENESHANEETSQDYTSQVATTPTDKPCIEGELSIETTKKDESNAGEEVTSEPQEQENQH